MAGPPNFTEARPLFPKYYPQKRRGSSHGGLMDEAAKRLGQLDWEFGEDMCHATCSSTSARSSGRLTFGQ
jgi:hypothetical protein